jgi:tetrapyrrole methylase family protein/MazG family protein
MAGEHEVIVVGLGPGRWDDLTLEARDVLQSASLVICRTTRHPTVEALRQHRPDLEIASFDDLYEQAESFAELYPRMAERLFERARALPGGASLVYAVPGHPLIAEESVRRLRASGPAQGITVRLVAGLSFIEPVCAVLDVDPLSQDMQVLDATLLADIPSAAMQGTVLPTKPALIAQAYNRRVASGVKLALGEIYPDDWEVTVVRSASVPGEEAVERMRLVDLDRGEHADHLTTIYVPPLPPLMATRVPEGLRYVTWRLRAPDGCPWDREQTHQSLRKYVLEEAYEVAEILDEWDGSPEQAEHLAEELGDLLLQVYLHSEIADQEDLFHIGDVYQAVTEKLIRRHPHVFGDAVVGDSSHVLRNWEVIKRQERETRGEDVEAESVLRGIPKSAPALYQAYELGRKAAKAGFEWPSVEGAVEKVGEEARELAEALEGESKDEQVAELGDLFFALATLARRLNIEPEDALTRSNARFRRRFEAMEQRLRAEGREPATLTLDEWMALWAEAKSATAASATR